MLNIVQIFILVVVFALRMKLLQTVDAGRGQTRRLLQTCKMCATCNLGRLSTIDISLRRDTPTSCKALQRKPWAWCSAIVCKQRDEHQKSVGQAEIKRCKVKEAAGDEVVGGGWHGC